MDWWRQPCCTCGLGRREQLASTGLGLGFAIPHCRVRDLDRILAAYVRPKAAVSFAAPDGLPVSDFLVLLVPKAAADEHLEILAEAARRFSDSDFRDRLRRCTTSHEVKQLFDDQAIQPA